MKNKQIKGMVDIGPKEKTKRVAVACATLKMSRSTFNVFVKHGSPKGNVLETAKIAGVMAVKTTPLIIPMCHPLLIEKVSVFFQVDKKNSQITVTAEVACEGKTGVEMEALNAVTVAALTIYDMMKWADKAMVITDIKLLHKRGGKSGSYTRK